ncbi:MAG: hypothetical protein PF690_06405 [Deltaproteobacteria bacterium]|jgi:hypothetical protein|nr:hypothetical protein [Deltaproteobacteria bacterium]
MEKLCDILTSIALFEELLTKNRYLFDVYASKTQFKEDSHG